jgi:hypothetical protein
VLPEASTYADVGAGSGGFAAEAHRRGHDILAYERSRVGRWLARRQGVKSQAFDLGRDLQGMVVGRTDAAYCLEVAEHLTPQLGERLITFLTLVAPRVVFSAARPGQGGAGHINEQPREYWTERFLRHDFGERTDLTRALRSEVVARGVGGAWFPVNLAVYEARADAR